MRELLIVVDVDVDDALMPFKLSLLSLVHFGNSTFAQLF